jgi:GNAT superfamily N-acetyltransferase
MIEIRDLRYGEIGECTRLVTREWGDTAGDRAMEQMIEMYRMTPSQHPPHFYVAVEDDKVIGFAGFKATMRMKDDYDLIWICLAPEAQGKGLGPS